MAVAKKTNGKSDIFFTTITLDDDQVVNVGLRRDAFEVGDQEALIEASDELGVIQGRLEWLKKQATEAADDREHQKWMGQYKEFGKKKTKLFEMLDFFIRKTVAQWDLALTEEDEKNHVYVPLTPEGLKTLVEPLRLRVFNEVTEKLRTRSEAEKKGLFGSFNGDTPTPKEQKVPFQASTSDTSSPCDTVSDRMLSKSGV